MSHDKVIRRACARESWNPRCCHRDQYCNYGVSPWGVILSVLQEDEDILNKLFSAHSFVDMRLEHVRQRRRFSFQFLVFKMAHDAGHSVSHQCLVLSAAQSRHNHGTGAAHLSVHEIDLITLLRKNQTQWP
jgi:hypothetical protein